MSEDLQSIESRLKRLEKLVTQLLAVSLGKLHYVHSYGEGLPDYQTLFVATSQEACVEYIAKYMPEYELDGNQLLAPKETRTTGHVAARIYKTESGDDDWNEYVEVFINERFWYGWQQVA